TGEVFLNYAEAMYNAYGADGDPEGYGMTAIQAFNRIRNRAKVRPLLPSELNQERIERERMVELSFEDHRFWDVRRWKKGVEYFGAPVNRIVITKDGADFSYAVERLEDRVFTSKMHWFPIPQSEIDNTGWQQNPDW
ncbi:MAG TPA: RagB/SusD family nutrient uptake outer membrane protein, partial [Marinilabiliaceae bacterium]|nr:RagB/SusD family nutrient uptake outer membrane protein [Marinilabiliaceae bacterium]